MCICALSGGRMEDRYLEIINPYGAGERTAKGKLYDDSRRAIDDLADAFGCLVRHTEETRGDIIGDAFMGGNLNDAGQFFTPDNVCELMAGMTNHDEKIVGKRVADPCCGSGRMLLAAARLNPHNFFFGQDTDLRCVRMTAINLALWRLRGEVLWGNSLTLKARGGYRTGFNGRGFIRELDPAQNVHPPTRQ